MNRLHGLVTRVRTRLNAPDPSNHVEYNRSSWDGYAARWESRGFRRALTARGVPVDDLEVLGDEWRMSLASLAEVIDAWIAPYVREDSVVAEIGVGGGRVAAIVADRVGRLLGFDISQMMLEHAGRALADKPNVHLELLESPRLPADLTESLDFVYSYDVFVHLDLHTMWKYVQEIERVLKPGGRAFLHTTNLTAPGGWARFAAQDRYTLDGHYFVTPEVVKTLVSHTALAVVKESQPAAGDPLLERDYLILLERGR
jgi:SAM-dependent methyltransferase